MINLLTLDTSTRWAGVGLYSTQSDVTKPESAFQVNANNSGGTTWHSVGNHTAELLPAALSLLEKFHKTMADVTHIGVAVGPGGFTSVRVAISLAMGLAQPNNLPLTALPTHLIEVMPWLTSSSPLRPIYSLLPAGAKQYSWARFEGDLQPVASGVDSAVGFSGRMLGSNGAVCGEAATSLRDHGAQILSGAAPTRSPQQMLTVAILLMQAGVFARGEVEPIYARPPSIGRRYTSGMGDMR